MGRIDTSRGEGTFEGSSHKGTTRSRLGNRSLLVLGGVVVVDFVVVGRVLVVVRQSVDSTPVVVGFLGWLCRWWTIANVSTSSKGHELHNREV